MIIVNMHEAKTKLSQLASRFLDGEEIIVAKNGRPIFKFAPVPNETLGERSIGFFNCDIDMGQFDDPIEGLEAYQ